MKTGNLKWFSPPVSQTVYGKNARNDERIRNQILDQFFADGFELISLPTLVANQNGSTSDSTLQTLDMQLRTDTTVQVAQFVSNSVRNKTADVPVKLSYAENVITKYPKHPLVSREYTQLGVENFMRDQQAAFAQTMQLLINIFGHIPELLLELSVDYPLRNFIAMFEDESMRNAVIQAIGMKAKHQIDMRKLTDDQQEVIDILFSTHSDEINEDSIKTLESSLSRLNQLNLVNSQQMQATLESVNNLVPLVESSSVRSRFDLAVPSIDTYYSGIHFNVYHAELPFALINGGQYLLSDLRAVGFTVRTDLLREIDYLNGTA